jgi:hypothetical protein
MSAGPAKPKCPKGHTYMTVFKGRKESGKKVFND